VGLDEELSLQKKGGYTRWVARNWYAANSTKKRKDKLRQKNKRSSPTSCKVHWE